MHAGGAEGAASDREPEVLASGPAAVWLDGSAERSVLGGKGAALDRLIGWGLPVPASAVVTTAAYERMARAPAVARVVARVRGGETVPAAEVDAVFLEADLPPDDLAPIVAMARRVGAGEQLAVRSSATVEDMARSSFAGQYRSVLAVDPGDERAVADAVRLVFASLWHPSACAYRRALGVDDDGVAMAVVLMRMVSAVRAGVAFTVDPSGHPGTARIESVEGYAEELVSGRRTPEPHVVPRDGPVDDPVLDDVLRFALDVERRAGSPQDVEWAWDGTTTWVVQARPITVISGAGDGFDDDPAELDELDLTTAAIGETLPGVLPPLVWSLASLLVEEAFRELLADLGVLPEDVDGSRALVRRVRGRAAMDFGRLRAMAERLPGSAPEQLEQEYFGSRRPGRPVAGRDGRQHHVLRRLDHDRRVIGLRHRAAREAGTMAAAAERLLAERPDLEPMSDEELLAYHLRLIDAAVRAATAQLSVAADAAATFGRLQAVLARVVEPSTAGRLADALVAHAGVVTAPPPSASAAVFAGSSWDELGLSPPAPPTGPTETDLGSWLVREVRAVPGLSVDSLAARFRLRAVRRLAHESTLRLALRERGKVAVLVLGGEARRVHLEMGRRLVERRLLAEVREVDLLDAEELRRAVRGAGCPPAQVLGQRARWRARYQQDPPLPARFHGVPAADVAVTATGTRLEGWATSPGRHRGRAQIVCSPLDHLDEGAVLVAESTDPSWSPLFLRAGAIVLERGGPLSHAAILARELGVPAVLNVPGATTRLAGAEVTVDGDAGIVVVHDDEEDPR